MLERTNERIFFPALGIDIMDGYWKVYFELNGFALGDAIRFIEETFITKSVWYYHPDSKRGKDPHIHGLVFNHSQTAETVRNKIKKRFSLVKQGSFSISNQYTKGVVMSEETNLPKYITYMSKGKYDPIYNNMYEDEYLRMLKCEWKEPTTVHISGDLQIITTGEVQTKRITMYELSREAEDMYLETHDPERMLDKGLQLKDIEKIVKETCWKYKKNCPPRLCADIIGDICGRLAPNHYHSQVKRYLGMTSGINIYT